MPLPKRIAKENPIAADDDDKGSQANENAVERVKERVTFADESEPKELPVDAPEDDEPEERPSRRERRNQRSEHEQARLAAEKRATDAEALVAAVRAQQIMAPPQQTFGQRQVDPLEQEAQWIDNELKAHIKLSDVMDPKKTTQADIDAWRDKYTALNGARTDVAARKAARGVQQQVPQQNMQYEVQRAHLQANYADVIQAGDHALQYADGLLRQKLGRERRTLAQVTLADYEAAMKQTRIDLRLPGAISPTPSEETRRKFAGLPKGGAPVNGSADRTIRMTKGQETMAEQMYRQERDPKTGKMRKLSPNESHAKWARTVGKKLLEGAEE